MDMYQNIAQLFEERARQHEKKNFIIFHDKPCAYGDLYKQSLSISHYLRRSLNGSWQKNIGILMPNSLPYISCLFGIMSAGHCAVSYNTMLKIEELQYQIGNSEIQALFTTSTFYNLLEPMRKDLPELKSIVLIDAEKAPGEKEGAEKRGYLSLSEIYKEKHKEPAVDLKSIQAEDIAAMFYTSGTTGKPKGCMLTHSNMLHNVANLYEESRSEETDTNLCILPLFHVNAQIVSLLSTLYAGASLVLEEIFKPRTFIATVKKYQCKTFSAVPTVYNYLRNMKEYKEGGENLSFVRACICGAAPMPVDVFKDFEKKFKARIIEGYGLSEGTCVSSVNPMFGERKIGSIGMSIKNQDMTIWDDTGKALPSGQIGQIVVKGKNIFKGYYKNPEATSQVIEGEWLKTGDMGYCDEEGYFFITGRKKEMIIRGGENIFPKEIEEYLYTHESVMECAVVGLPDKRYGERVLACVVRKEGYAASEKEFITFLRSKIASYKVPNEVRIFDEFPKTSTGKIQKHEIRKQLTGDLQTVRRIDETLNIPYKWALGKALSKYFTATKYEEKIYASHVPGDKQLNVWPKLYNPWNMKECLEWKELDAKAVLHSFTEVFLEFPSQKVPPPYFVGLLQISGASTYFFHIIKPGPGAKDFSIGQTLRPVWASKEKRKGDLFDIEYFQAVD